MRRIFDAAVELPRAARGAFLERACEGDAELRARVEAILRVDGEAEGFLEGATWVPCPEPAPAPAWVGPYRIVEAIGRGGMGVVYRAEGPAGAVAVKTVAVPEPGMLAGIRREIQALSRLAHPGVVRILEHGIAEGIPWYAMEVVEGPSLREAVRGGPPGQGFALTLLRRLCGVLAYVHGEGVVHRDLKPDNVRVRPGGLPVLLDFGLTTEASGRASRDVLEPGGDVAGTADYMSPEQALGLPLDARSDLYALGCMLRELAAPLACGDALGPLVERLLATDPAARPGHAADVAAELVRLGAEAGIGWSDAPAARSYVYRPSLRGRDDTLQALLGHAPDVEAGRGAVVLVAGDAGAGKTRLLLEAATILEGRGWDVLSGGCAAPSDLAPSPATLQPFRRVLRILGERCRSRGPAEVARVLGRRSALLARYEPSLGEAMAAELPPAQERRRALRALGESLGAAAAARPLLVVLDDLQWADATSFEALRALRDRPLLLAGAYLLGEAPGPLRDLAADDRVARLELGPLDARAIAGVVSDMLALPRPPVGFVRHLTDASEGSPFYVAEYLRTAVDEGRIGRDASGAWLLPDARSAGAALPMPRSLRALARARIAALPDGARAFAGALAALGREATAELLAEVIAMTDEARLDAAAILVARHVVEEPRPGRLRFTNDPLREAAYEALGAGERQGLHRSAAAAIERRGVDGPRAQAALGRHLRASGDLERARPHLLAAARQMTKLHALEEARRLYGDYLELAGKTAESVTARHELGWSVLNQLRASREAAAEIERALADARDLGLPSAEAALLLALQSARYNMGDHDAALATCREARAAAESLGDRRIVAEACLGQGAILCETGRLDEARTATEEGLREARAAGNDLGVLHALTNLAAIAQEQGDQAEARRHYEVALPAARIVGGASEAVVLSNLASLSLVAGDFADAERLATAALEASRRAARADLEAGVLTKLANVRNTQGDHEAEIELWEQGVGMLRELDALPSLAHALEGYAVTLLDLGRLERAEALLLEARRIAGAVSARLPEAFIETALARLAGLRGEADAIARARRALESLEGLGSRAGIGTARALLASLERRRGDLDAARRHARDGLAAFGEAGDPMGQCECLRELAEAELLAGGAPEPHLAKAEGIVARLGLAPGNTLAVSVAKLRGRVGAPDLTLEHRAP